MIDFAYAIHSAVGNKMVGAKINGVIVPIDRVPKNGEIIEILTSSSSKGPSRDWLKIVKTGQARTKIRQWFKKEQRPENIVLGRTEVEKEIRRYCRTITDAEIDEIVVGVAKRIGIQDADDFYNTLGFGGISLQRFLPRMKEEAEKIAALREPAPVPATAEDEVKNIKIKPNTRVRSHGGVIVDGERGCQIKFAKCCNPLPGDKIIGFITRGFGVSLHKSDCLNVLNAKKDPESASRWVKAEWEKDDASEFGTLYEAALQLELEDGIGVIATISLALAEMKVSIIQINTQKQKNGDLMIVNLTVGCKNTSHYDSIVSKLRQLPHVVSVSRGFSH